MSLPKKPRVLNSSPEVQRSIEELGVDLIQWNLMVHLDARSLARCRSVCKTWKSLGSADFLWLHHCCEFLTTRASLPIKLIAYQEHLKPRDAFDSFIVDALKKKLCPPDFCGRTWELGVKPVCGAYWYYLDPTTRGQPGLVRYFNCDGSLTAGPRDPIWGGQESNWRFVFGDGNTDQYVKINYWPLFTVMRLGDGRWRLENKWATYTTQPDLYLGSGNSICKEAAPPCSGCDYSRLRNAVTMMQSAATPRHNVLKRMICSSVPATEAPACQL